MASVLDFINKLRKQGKNVVFCGDVNTAHNAIDLARPKENEGHRRFCRLCDLKRFKENERPKLDGFVEKQVLDRDDLQKIREAERENIFDTYTKRIGEIINGTVHRFENRTIIVDLGKTEAILPPREQFAKDVYRQGDTIRAVLREVKRTLW